MEGESQVETVMGGKCSNGDPEEGQTPRMSSMPDVQAKTPDRAPVSRDEGTQSGFRLGYMVKDEVVLRRHR